MLFGVSFTKFFSAIMHICGYGYLVANEGEGTHGLYYTDFSFLEPYSLQ